MESVVVGANTVLEQVIVLADSTGNLINATANRLLVDGSGVTQPVSVASPLTTNRALGTTTVTGVSVTTTSAQIIASNASRKSLLIINNSTVVVYVKSGTATATNASIAIQPNGGTFQTDTTSSAFQAIVASGTASVTVVEDA
ncbi:MAG: hypothetical protein H0X33_13170 [Taibaiella sp.]|nr:hypothetical protein [Taibaiella sp.]